MKGILTNRWIQAFVAIVVVAGFFAYQNADNATEPATNVEAETENTANTNDQEANTTANTTPAAGEENTIEVNNNDSVTVIKDEGKLEITTND